MRIDRSTAQNNCEQIIQIRRCSEPEQKVKQIYQALKYKSTPFKKRKVVVHKPKPKEGEIANIQAIDSG